MQPSKPVAVQPDTTSQLTFFRPRAERFLAFQQTTGLIIESTDGRRYELQPGDYAICLPHGMAFLEARAFEAIFAPEATAGLSCRDVRIHDAGPGASLRIVEPEPAGTGGVSSGDNEIVTVKLLKPYPPHYIPGDLINVSKGQADIMVAGATAVIVDTPRFSHEDATTEPEPEDTGKGEPPITTIIRGIFADLREHEQVIGTAALYQLVRHRYGDRFNKQQVTSALHGLRRLGEIMSVGRGEWKRTKSLVVARQAETPAPVSTQPEPPKPLRRHDVEPEPVDDDEKPAASTPSSIEQISTAILELLRDSGPRSEPGINQVMLRNTRLRGVNSANIYTALRSLTTAKLAWKDHDGKWKVWERTNDKGNQ